MKKRIGFVSKLEGNDQFILSKIEISRKVLFNEIEELTGIEVVDSSKISEDELGRSLTDTSWVDETLYYEVDYEYYEEIQGNIVGLTSKQFTKEAEELDTNIFFVWEISYYGEGQSETSEDRILCGTTEGRDFLYFSGFNEEEIVKCIDLVIAKYDLTRMATVTGKYTGKYLPEGEKADFVIKYVTSLEHIQIDHPYGVITEIDITELQYCDMLESITFVYNSLSKVDLTPLKHCYYLKSVSVAYNNLVEIDLSPLQNCKHLDSLDLVGNELTSIDLSPLQHCPRFRNLELRNNKLTALNLTPLQHCKNLTTIDLSENQLSSIDFSPLQHCISLQEIDLRRNKLSEVDFEPLQHCKKLTSINLEDNEITEVDLSPLEHCRLIKYLNLSDNPIKDIDTTPLDNRRSILRL